MCQAQNNASEWAKILFFKLKRIASYTPSIWAMQRLIVWFPNDRISVSSITFRSVGQLCPPHAWRSSSPEAPSLMTRRVIAVPARQQQRTNEARPTIRSFLPVVEARRMEHVGLLEERSSIHFSSFAASALPANVQDEAQSPPMLRDKVV